MPELPEVEVSRLGITPHMLGETIKSIRIHQPQLRWRVPDEVMLAEHQVICEITRRSKYLIITTAVGSIILHLGMSGNLRVIDNSVPLKKHDHIEIELENGKVLRLNDPRRFGACLWQNPNEQHATFAKLGPEPLTDDFDVEYLYEKSRNRKTAIKQFLMDNAIVVGVGNIYANESLFKAGINPKREAGKISKKRYQLLVPIVKQTLSDAITQGGTTLKDFAQTDGKPGYFAQQLLVYGRKGEPCVTCNTQLTEIRQGQRSTVYCKKCQK